MGPALAQLKPTLFTYVDGRIDAIPEDSTDSPECTQDSIKSVADGYQGVFRSLGSGEVPSSLPSIKAIAQPCRVLIFDSAFPALFADDTLDARTTEALGRSTDAIREAFVAGDTHGVLKAAARPLAEPVVDDAIGKIRERLDEGDRVNVIRVLAENSNEFTEEELRVELADAREAVVRYRSLGGTIAFLMLYGGAILLAVLHLPKLSAAMRWPGIFLFVSGGLIFIVGKILESKAVDFLITAVDKITANAPGIPGPAVNLLSDLVLSFGQQLTTGFAAPAFTVLIIGALLFAASIVLSIVKPVIPGLS